VVLSGNRKTAYYHALFSYNQLVTQSMVNVVIKTEKHFRIRIIKVGVNHFLLYLLHVLTIVPKSWTSLCELIHFISLLHVLHFTTSSTSLSWHIQLRWLKETTELAEGVECGGW